MNIDQRLEALTQTVELLAAMQLDNEKRWEKRHEVWEKRWAEISTALQQDGEHIRALVRVAELHHERLSRLEDQQQ
jgi:prephenate dehydrogenase